MFHRRHKRRIGFDLGDGGLGVLVVWRHVLLVGLAMGKSQKI